MIIRTPLQLLVIFSVGLCLVSVTNQASCQELDDDNRCVLMFDVNLGEIRSSKLGELIDIDDAIADEHGIPTEVVASVERIFGAVSAPEGLQELMILLEGGDRFDEPVEEAVDICLDGFVTVVFSNEKPMKEIRQMVEALADAETINGKEYFRPKDQQAKGFLTTLGEKTLTFGTEAFVTNDVRAHRTDRLSADWQALPKAPVRIAADFASAEKFVNESVDLLQKQLKEELEHDESIALLIGYSQRLRDVASLRIALDPNAETMIQASVTGKDADATKRLDHGISALLSLGRAFGDGWLISEALPAPINSQIQEIVADMHLTTDGNELGLAIGQPEHFFETIELARSAAQSSRKLNRIKQLALAVHNFHDSTKRCPFQAPETFGDDAKISWRARILPYMEMEYYFEAIDLQHDWDSEENRLGQTGCPNGILLNSDDEWGRSTSNDCDVVWLEVPGQESISLADISNADGTSQTIMLLETKNPVNWLQPADISVDEAVTMVRGLADGEKLAFARYDGSCGFLDNTVSEENLRRMFDPFDGEIVDWDR